MQTDKPVHDFEKLNRALDRAKSAVFLSKNPAFFGSLMCSLNFLWSDEISTAATDGLNILWNPDFFNECSPKLRETVLKHELWHVARLHHLRTGTRHHRLWNIACDYRINNDLETEGCTFDSLNVCKDHSFDTNGIMAEEDIYDLLAAKTPPPPEHGSWGQGNDEVDMLPQTDGKINQQAVNNVVKAVQQAKLAGQAGSIPGQVEEVLRRFLEPQIPWRQVLMSWFTDQLEEDHTWRKPSRRYQSQGMYLPSRFTDDGRLEHLCYYLDVSGSISNDDILVFTSEVKYIQEVLQPEKLTLIQFSTQITATNEYASGDPFDEITIIGRGGTSLVPVREHIEKVKPTAAIIFSDLHVPPMQPLVESETPVVWIVMHNKGAKVPFGKMIHIA